MGGGTSLKVMRDTPLVGVDPLDDGGAASVAPISMTLPIRASVTFA